MSIELSIVALFYNEQEAAEVVLRDVYQVMVRRGVRFEIVAVDNGSVDATTRILERLSGELPEVRIVTVPVNRGAGYGAIRGLYAAKGEVVVGIPGDGQVDPNTILGLLELMRREGADIAHGLRRSRPDGWIRLAVSKTYNALLWLLFRVPFGDMNGPPKLLRREALAALQLCSDDHFLECEMMLKARRLGLRVATEPVDFLPRTGGISNIRMKDCLAFLHHLMVIRFTSNDPWNVNAVTKDKTSGFAAMRRRAIGD
jgi:glycosyltransferase involved in cell wall biosynthesis